MDDLILESLEIQNFRAFRHLQVEKLGRVNLFVGKNNVGKSSLLEALWLYARRGTPSLIWRILEARNESKRLVRLSPDDFVENESRLATLRYLFHGRRDIKEQNELIQIGPVGDKKQQVLISMALGATQQLSFFYEDEQSPSVNVPSNLHLSISFQNDEIEYWIDRNGRTLDVNRGVANTSSPSVQCVFVPATGVGLSDVGRLWDNIALTNQELDVIAALRIITPEVDRVSLVGSSERASTQQRTPIVKVAGFDEPMPLRSLGEGMNRMFGIALALANAKDGMLLIDEVESGLHYSVQPDMWRLIFEMAHRLNVQVFATTHSWDCITAFQQAARDDVHEEGLLIRLERRDDDVRATLFDEDELAIATREQIEVR